MMLKLSAVLFIVAAVSFSDTATQTDWSGGGGVPGPVTDWGDGYDVADQIDDSGGSLCLETGPVEHMVDDNGYGAKSVSAADVDGDGDTDVIGAAFFADDITWWENTNGTGTEWTEHIIDGDFDGACTVHAADVDGDGDTDVLGGASMDDQISWWENTNGTGTAWTEHIVDGDFNFARSVYADDVDGDGNTDILGAGYLEDNINWWENYDGLGTTWIVHIVDYEYYGASSVYSSDVDGDGDTDILGAAYDDYGDRITWWENANGAGTSWTEHTVGSTYDGARSVYAADVDGDGDTDVLGAAHLDDEITWWENTDGTGTIWSEHIVDSDFDGANSVCSADLDGDGDTDILGAATNAHEITWWENADGTGASWIEHSVDCEFWQAEQVFAADVDGDGETDVLGAAYLEDETKWWTVSGYLSSGFLESSILDAGEVLSWDTFSSDRILPTGTTVGFQFRSSQDSTSMGAWSDTVFDASISLSGVLGDSTDFMQYRAVLQTTDSGAAPVLNEVSVSYSVCVSIEETGSAGFSDWNLESPENPSSGSLEFLVTVPQRSEISLVLHDISGRRVGSLSRELSSGTHSICFGNLLQGVYFCTMRTGNLYVTEKAVVLR